MLLLLRTAATAPTTLTPQLETWDTGGDVAGTLDGDLDWNDFIGSHGWGVVSDAAQLENTGGITHGGRVDTALGARDYQVAMTVSEFSYGGAGLLVVGPAARMTGTAAITYYTGVVAQFDASPAAAVYKFVAGTQTQLGSSVPVTPHANMSLVLRVVGSAIKFFVDGSLLVSVTDTDIAAGEFAGLQGVANGANRVRVDTWRVTTPSSRILPELLTLAPLTGVH